MTNQRAPRNKREVTLKINLAIETAASPAMLMHLCRSDPLNSESVMCYLTSRHYVSYISNDSCLVEYPVRVMYEYSSTHSYHLMPFGLKSSRMRKDWEKCGINV